MTENKTITTPSGNVVIFKSFLSGFDQRAYRRVLLQMNDDAANKGEILDKMEDAILQACVVSLDGSVEDVVSRICALDAADYEIILKESNELMEGFSKKKDEILSGSMKTGSEETK